MTLWGKLKDLEIELTELIASRGEPKEASVLRLRELFSECSKLPDAEEAICFHGSKSLLAQIDGDYDSAILHREIEAEKIKRIYRLEEEDSSDGWALQNLQESDIEKRSKILQRLRQQRSEQDGGGQPATRSEST